jgi:predicted NAD-dependent protein-ADP-ribosyltransferase YbiA (DUF1768 family)
MVDLGEAKHYAAKYAPQHDESWSEKQEAVINELLIHKFDHCGKFRNKHPQSSNKSLLHKVNNNYWGVGSLIWESPDGRARLFWTGIGVCQIKQIPRI